MDLNLRGKTAIVTGVSGKGDVIGVGASVCEVFAQEGMNVVANYIVDEAETLAFMKDLSTKYGTRCIGIYGDISKPEDIDHIIEKTMDTFGEVDILVNNAGILPVSNIMEMADEEWERVIKINLTGTFFFCKRFAKCLVKQGRPGRILNVSSKSGFSVNSPGRSHYATSKGAIVTLTKALAREFTQYGIIVNGIVPGILRTPLNNHLFEDPEVEKNYVKRIPMGRMTEPVEIAYMAAFLVSDKAESTPGSMFDVTGGMLL